MGNNTSYVDRSIIVAQSKNPNLLVYPLSNEQSKELFNQYSHVLFKVLQELHYNKNCPSIISKVRRNNVTYMNFIGYCKGEIVAFLFDQDIKPFIIFEHNNTSFKKSIRLLQKSIKKNPIDQDVEHEKLLTYGLVMTTMNIKNDISCQEYYWITDVSEVIDNY